MAISNNEADAGEAFPRLCTEISLCTGLADARPSAEASISAMANGLRPMTPRGCQGFMLSGMLASCHSLLRRRRNRRKEVSSRTVRGQQSKLASEHWE